METAYAVALWKAIEGGMQPSKAVHALCESLKHHGRETLMPRIAKAFARVAKREIAKSGYVLSVAHRKDEVHARHAAKHALGAAGVSHPEFQLHTDDTLIGGWRLEGGDTLVDASFKKQLLTIYNRATSA